MRWALLFFLHLGVLPSVSCRTGPGETTGGGNSPTDNLRQQLVALKHREKALERETALARNPAPYLLANLSGQSVEFKAKGHTLRSFKIKRLVAGPATFPDVALALAEVKPIQKTDRPRIKPGEGEAATAKAVEKNLWGLDRMPLDYDLICRDGMILEIRALPSEQSGAAPVQFIKTLYRRTLDRYRRGKTTDRNPSRTIQLWLDENDSRLLFWSLPKQLSIVIIQIGKSLD